MDFRDYEILFDLSETAQHTPRSWISGIIGQRTRRIIAGDMAYVDTFPIWDTETKRAAREESEHRGSSDAQKRINARNRQRQLEILINANFGEGDYLLTLTYADDTQPEDAEGARKDAANYMRRLKTLRKSKHVGPLKYIFVVEETHSNKRGTRYHIHAIINGDGITRDEAESKWLGGLANTRKVQDQPGKLTGYARYMSKTQTEHNKGQSVSTQRLFYRSRNLKNPRPTIADKKISRRRAERIATETVEHQGEIFAKLYPGYVLLECKVYTSSIVPGVYIRAVLQKETTHDSKIPHPGHRSARAGGPV